ncbi:hypothetical protein BRADI_1g72595v3 [Brachypodium distachyon]|uniref:Uncharacterized protein n=1 Tax=Brachypodium distachyon TaxID=15368 RepID=A0A2K2DUS6_BRADI|nr:hypothetical protein BRADI_1g72595v3 [Brachypodium distachyon]
MCPSILATLGASKYICHGTRRTVILWHHQQQQNVLHWTRLREILPEQKNVENVYSTSPQKIFAMYYHLLALIHNFLSMTVLHTL